MSTDSGHRRWNLVMRKIVMFYLLVAFPLLIIYMALVLLTDLHGQLLVYCLLPVGIVLLLIYILWLVRPGILFRFKSDQGSDRQSSEKR